MVLEEVEDLVGSFLFTMHCWAALMRFLNRHICFYRTTTGIQRTTLQQAHSLNLAAANSSSRIARAVIFWKDYRKNSTESLQSQGFKAPANNTCAEVDMDYSPESIMKFANHV